MKAGRSAASAKSNGDTLRSDSVSPSLLERLRGGDSTAWNRLLHLYSPLITFWCRRQRVPEQDVDDLLQDVFQSVAAHLNRFRREGPADTFRGWLRTITTHKVCDYFRRTAEQPRSTGGTEALWRMAQLPAPGEPCEDAEEVQLTNRMYQQALALVRPQFEDRTWRAFWRVVVDGQSAGDVASELAMRPGTVRVAKARVLQRLRRELGEIVAGD
jgi:RNA polymerase sigma-70 factor (ECF subfamily)